MMNMNKQLYVYEDRQLDLVRVFRLTNEQARTIQAFINETGDTSSQFLNVLDTEDIIEIPEL